MKKTDRRRIEVFAHWSELAQPTLMGTLYAIPGKGKEIFSFEYDSNWLKGKQSRRLDPLLGLYRGPQYTLDERQNFGIFLDSSPDRWGRILMQRREAFKARENRSKPKILNESDYLLGVYDGHRMGALRFRTDPEGPFLNDNNEQAAPPWASLRELENACLQIEKDDADANPKYGKWLKMLIAPGSSLGGARPKASVIDEKGHLWIAKFPSASDEFDIGGWEKVVHQLAKSSKINVAVASSQCFSSRHHTYLNRRFDRTEDGARLHFASAMTLLNHIDGDNASTGVSYLELVNFISKEGANVTKDLEQLWRRIVFFICVSNVDDHLRNHGFMLHPKGWALSPAYDMNPSPTGDGLRLNISETDNSQDFGLALSVIEYFRIKRPQAEKTIREVIEKVKNWRSIATVAGISNREQERMKPAFRETL